jgi:hypothetical protein
MRINLNAPCGRCGGGIFRDGVFDHRHLGRAQALNFVAPARRLTHAHLEQA